MYLSLKRVQNWLKTTGLKVHRRCLPYHGLTYNFSTSQWCESNTH